MEKYSKSVLIVWQIAAQEAANANSQFIEPEHMIIGLCSLEKLNDDQVIPNDVLLEKQFIDEVFTSVNLEPSCLRRQLRKNLLVGEEISDREIIHRSPKCKNLFDRAKALQDNGETTCCELLITLLDNPNETISFTFNELDLDLPHLLSTARTVYRKEYSQQENEDIEAINVSFLPSNTPYLSKYGRDLTQEAKDGRLGDIVGRRSEMLQVIQVLSRLKKNNPVLVGEAGVGKTAIVEGLALRIIQGKDAHVLAGKRLIELNISSLIAGTQYRGEFEDRLNKIIAEVRANPEIVLFIDELHTIIGAGQIGSGSLDASNILKPALARGDFRCIGATTISEYRKYIETDRALERRFEMVMVFEPSRDETLEILQAIQPRLEGHHKVHFTQKALEAAIDLSIRFDPGHQLPDKAISLLDTAGSNSVTPFLSMIHSPSEDRSIQPEVTRQVNENDIAEIVARQTGIDIGVISPYIGKTYLSRIKDLGPFIKQRLIGQDHVVEQVSKRLLVAQSGLSDNLGPLAVFLFAGPSGVGKTQFGLYLAEFLFGSQDSVIRLDMSEFKEEHSVSKLIGSPPGYIGYEEEGQLTSKLRTHPNSIVLLDECEKAHPRVYDMFLQVFDAGRLTDSKGRTIDTRNSIFIMTTNISIIDLGTKIISEQAIENETRSILSEYFRIEFLNRIDDILVFRMLNYEDARIILVRELEELKGKVKSRYKVNLGFSEQAINYLLIAGYNPQLGVRELQRIVEKLVQSPLSLAIANGKNIAKDWIFDVKSDIFVLSD
jgi:ATP-dependent Clp protease ATP-binding subunit ClpC